MNIDEVKMLRNVLSLNEDLYDLIEKLINALYEDEGDRISALNSFRTDFSYYPMTSVGMWNIENSVKNHREWKKKNAKKEESDNEE